MEKWSGSKIAIEGILEDNISPVDRSKNLNL
jgi:hypothetical protein